MAPPSDGLHHGGLDFEEAALVQEIPDELYDGGALAEDLPGTVVDQEVHVALAIARFDVLKAVIFLREGPHGFGQQPHLGGFDSQFAGLGAEQFSGHADDVSDFEFFEDAVRLGPEVVTGGIDLDFAAGVLDVEERDFSEGSVGHDAAAEREGQRFPGKDLFVLVPVGLDDVPDLGGAAEIVGI